MFSDHSANKISILGGTSAGITKNAFVHIGTSSVTGQIAVDWISSNVYWSDSLYGWVGLQALPRNIEGSEFIRTFKILVDRFLDSPSGLAVHANMK